MEFISGMKERIVSEVSDILKSGLSEQVIVMNGAIHKVVKMSDFTFITLRTRDGLVQCIKDFDLQPCEDFKEGMTLKVQGTVKQEIRAPFGFELHLLNIEVLSRPAAPMPLPIHKWKLDTSLATKLELRPIALRNIRERSKFKIQEGIVRGFRDFLLTQGFTEIHTPKIVAGNAEGGSNVFKFEYFGKKAFLAQSPQLYKQMMVGVFDRVFETAPVFRAEKHNTARHINEYTSLDFEMGYIDGFEDIMEMETKMFKYIFELLDTQYHADLKRLNIKLPQIDRIPVVRFDEAKQLVAQKYHRKMRTPNDLEPEEEALMGEYFKEEYGSDFVFVTHYPSKKRPFYAMDDPENPIYTLSFDLIYKGLEVTTGGQRIHSYEEQCSKLIQRDMSPLDFESYLMIHKYGMPPHGGLGMGLERLTMKLLEEENVRETTLFPRDLSRLEP